MTTRMRVMRAVNLNNKDRPKNPIISTSKNNPTQSNKQILKMRKDIASRYSRLGIALREYLEIHLKGSEITVNKDWFFIGKMIYSVNADYDYSMDGNQLAHILGGVHDIVDNELLEGGIENIWSGEYIEEMYRTGTINSYHNLSSQSPLYSQSTALSSLLFSERHQKRISLAYTSTFNDWKELSDKLKGELGRIISNSVSKGINPRETAKIINDRLGVSLSKARTIAQTEQVGILRQAIWDEDSRVNAELGIKTKLLHQSAFKPTTRLNHAERSGKTYTAEEVEKWYEEDGNRYNCYCTQYSVLVDENGKPYAKTIIDRLEKQKNKWFDEQENKLSSTKDINTWSKNNIADHANFPRGTDVDELKKCAELAKDIQDRFALDKLRYIGSVNGDIYQYSIPKSVVASYSNDGNALLLRKSAFDRNYLKNIDEISRSGDLLKDSIDKVGRYKNKELSSIVNNLKSLSWFSVSTPEGVIAHEFGHAMHYKYQEVFKIAARGYNKGYQLALSGYGKTKLKEYIAESFSLYIANYSKAEKRLYPPLFEIFKKLDRGK